MFIISMKMGKERSKKCQLEFPSLTIPSRESLSPASMSVAVVLSRVWLFVTSVACQAPLSMKFSRQEYGGGLPPPTPEDLPDPEIEPTSLVSPVILLESIM